jgi:Ca2+-binding RTX toxin-like protein
VTLNVTSTDHGDLSVQQQFTINVTDVPENQTITMTSRSFTAPSSENWTVTGTSGADTIVTLGGNDIIRGAGGDDNISTGTGDDTFLYSGTGNGFDTVDGGAGTDTIRATAAKTVIGLHSMAGVESISSGGFANVSIAGSASADSLDFSNVQLSGITRIDTGAGNDTIVGSSVADTIAGGAGDDILKGGGGNDTFQVNASGGLDNYDGGEGTDTIVATGKNVVIGIGGVTGVETISSGGFSGVQIAGSSASDTFDFTSVQLTGIAGIDGGAGDDFILGNGAANRITGGAGLDTLTGGGGADTFVYLQVSNSSVSQADVIQDFAHGTDKIDLSAIDAIAGGKKNEAFTFVGDKTGIASFHSAAGQLWVAVENGVKHIYADVDGGGADFAITLGGQPQLTSADFIL